jgi:ribA/ribD-fused uncharacterized protein
MIDTFRGQYRFLSNFFPMQYPIYWCGTNYPTSEHFYQAMKTKDFNLRLHISQLPTPGDTKKYGRTLQLRDDWEQIKDLVMETGIMLKFTMNLDLRNQLVETSDKILVEGNTWHDNYWGNCSCAKCVKWPGANMLGEILMMVRTKIITIG